jgi:hypothetical protein
MHVLQGKVPCMFVSPWWQIKCRHHEEELTRSIITLEYRSAESEGLHALHAFDVPVDVPMEKRLN